MKKATLLVPVLMLVSAAIVFGGQLQAPGGDDTPVVGEPAPDFERPLGLGGSETLGLEDFRGRNKVLVAFYIADFTGG